MRQICCFCCASRGGFALWPGALPLDPDGGSAPDPRYRLAFPRSPCPGLKPPKHDTLASPLVTSASSALYKSMHSLTHSPTHCESLWVYQSSSMSPQKSPFATGIWALSNTWLIRTPGVYNKTASWLVQPFMQGSPMCPTKANRQTRLTDRQTTKNLLTFLQALSVSVALSHI